MAHTTSMEMSSDIIFDVNNVHMRLKWRHGRENRCNVDETQ